MQEELQPTVVIEVSSNPEDLLSIVRELKTVLKEAISAL
jgi:hypothetical protein